MFSTSWTSLVSYFSLVNLTDLGTVVCFDLIVSQSQDKQIHVLKSLVRASCLCGALKK